MTKMQRWFWLVAGVVFTAPSLAWGQSATKTYSTEVTLEQNSCKDVTVRPGPTEIVRGPGSDSLTLTHAGQVYRGSVTTEGTFATVPRDLVFGTTTYSIAIIGQFAGAGFTATVTVGVKEQGAENGCSYTVKWIGRSP
jgi:hypothetical protein